MPGKGSVSFFGLKATGVLLLGGWFFSCWKMFTLFSLDGLN